jgi:DNA-binding NarL/FixJ family response regulator
MSDAALKAVKTAQARRLRVSIRAEDPETAAELRELIEQAGHEVVDAPQAGFAAAPDAEPRALLTPRELEVLGAIGEGLTNKAIARRLAISLHTVKFHVESLFRKLGARTRTEALAKASERRVDV